MAIPVIGGPQPDTPQAALQTVTDALRFARERASLTGDVHGIDVANNELRVFRLSSMTTPATPEYTVLNPLTLKPYSVKFDEGAFRDVQLGSWSLQASGTCNASSRVGFDAQGLARCTDPLNLRVTPQLQMSYRGATFNVIVDPLTGRIRYQR